MRISYLIRLMETTEGNFERSLRRYIRHRETPDIFIWNIVTESIEQCLGRGDERANFIMYVQVVRVHRPLLTD